LVEQVMGQAPYKSAAGCFGLWTTALLTAAREGHTLQNRYANLTLVHGRCMPVGSIKSRFTFPFCNQKALTPNDFPSLAVVAERLAQFERHYEQMHSRSSGALPAAISTMVENCPSKTANHQPWRPDPDNTLVNLRTGH